LHCRFGKLVKDTFLVALSKDKRRPCSHVNCPCLDFK
jgi:hypothetical protein